MQPLSDKADKAVEKVETTGLPPLPEPKATRILPVYMIPLHLLEAAEWNMTEPSAKSLDNLTQNIRENGFAETLLVIPLLASTIEVGTNRVIDGKFRILSGHDKALAATAAGLTEVPCSVVDGETSLAMQKLLTVRMNVIHKRLNPAKFVRLFNEVAQEYGEELTRTLMMFTNTSELSAMLDKVRNAMPKEMRGELDKKKSEIKTVDDLAAVVGEIYNRAGSTLDRGYLVFTFGGQEHVYVQMSPALRNRIQALMDKSEVNQKHISELLEEALGVGT